MTEDLKPCPKCGGYDFAISITSDVISSGYIQCRECGYRFEYNDAGYDCDPNNIYAERDVILPFDEDLVSVWNKLDRGNPAPRKVSVDKVAETILGNIWVSEKYIDEGDGYEIEGIRKAAICAIRACGCEPEEGE